MDLHIYRNSQDRWNDLRPAARDRGAVLALHAFTLDELVERITPDAETASAVQGMVVVQQAIRQESGSSEPANLPLGLRLSGLGSRYAYDAIRELKAARVRPSEMYASGEPFLGSILEKYETELGRWGLWDPQDRCVLASTRIAENAVPWLRHFSRVVLHALYDLTEAEFVLIRSLIENLSGGGVVVLFNTTTNVKPTQFAEWTWQRFIQNESLADKTFPEFCRASNRGPAVLDRLFVFQPADLLPQDNALRIVEVSSRYKEVEKIGADISDLLLAGEDPNEIAVVVRHIETYGEALEDVFLRYGIPHRFETGVPLVRVPFIKYWLALLDLAAGDRSREALARVMSSAYFDPRLSPRIDVERTLAGLGYIDRYHLRASALAARQNSPLTADLERFENWLDEMEKAEDMVLRFLAKTGSGKKGETPSSFRFVVPGALTDRDRQAWRYLVEELEAIDSIAGKMSFAEFRRIASETAGIRTVHRVSVAVAQNLSSVRIVSPRSLGCRQYRWIFAPGLVDGEFPARSSTNPLLSDETIEAINGHIRPRRLMTSRDRSRQEPLYLFMILDSASERVTLTYPGATLEGEAIYPSFYIGEIARHYAESPVEHQDGMSRRPAARTRADWLKAVADEWRKGSITDERVRDLLGDDIVARAHLEQSGVDRARVSKGLWPVDRIWNPSELNSLSACPFLFLARHALKLRVAEPPDFEVPASELGILAHNVLKDFYSQPVPASDDEAKVRMEEIILRRLADVDINGRGPRSVFEPSFWKIRRRQLVSVLMEYVHFAVRDALDGYRTLPEYLDAPLPAARLGPISLAGRPDHVAVHCDRNQSIDAIRIDDFKYSAASSLTTKQLQESFQIPVYAYLAMRALNADENVRLESRYLLLRSPNKAVVSTSITPMLFDGVRARIEKLLQRTRAGRFQPDPASRQECEYCDYRRLCRLYGS